MEQNSSYGVSSGGVLGGGVTGGSVSGGGTTVSTEPVSQTPDDPPAEVEPSAPNPDNKPKPKPSVETTEPDGQGEPAADDSEPRIPDITEDDGSGSGSGEWCGNDEDTTTGKGDFFDENKELIKKLKYVLEFVYPDSGIDLAKLLTGGKGYIAMLAGGGKPSGSDTTPSPDDPAPITDPIVTSPPSGQPKPAGQTTPTEQTQPVQTPPQPDSIVTEDELDRIIDAYNAINQEADKRINKYSRTKFKLTVQIEPEERKNASKRDLLKKAIARLEEYVLNRCGKKIINLVDIVDILMYIHDFLAETVRYELVLDERNSLWGCLADPKSITSSGDNRGISACLGYSTAFVFLCCYVNCVNSTNRSAITVDYCQFSAYNGYSSENKYNFTFDKDVDHIFNCVKIDNKWYYIDAAGSNRSGKGKLGEVKEPPYGYEHNQFLTGDVDSYNEMVLNGKDGKKCTIAGSPEDLVVPGKSKEKSTLRSSKENLYYDHLFTKYNDNSDKMKKDYLGKNQEMAKNYKCSFIDDIVMINEKSSKDYCIHVAFVIRGDKPETAPYRVGKKEENIPLIYYYLIDLAKSGKKVLAEIVYKNGSSKSEVKSMYSNNTQYIINLFEQSNSESAVSLGIGLKEDSLNGTDYYVPTVFIRRKPKGSS